MYDIYNHRAHSLPPDYNALPWTGSESPWPEFGLLTPAASSDSQEVEAIDTDPMLCTDDLPTALLLQEIHFVDTMAEADASHLATARYDGLDPMQNSSKQVTAVSSTPFFDSKDGNEIQDPDAMDLDRAETFHDIRPEETMVSETIDQEIAPSHAADATLEMDLVTLKPNEMHQDGAIEICESAEQARLQQWRATVRARNSVEPNQPPTARHGGFEEAAHDDFNNYDADGSRIVASSPSKGDDRLYHSDTACRYDFRPGAREHSDEYQTLTFDQDNTGDYNTDEERKQNRLLRKRKTRRNCAERNADEGTGEESPSTRSKRSHKEDLAKDHLMFKARFTTEQSRHKYICFVKQYNDKLREAEDEAEIGVYHLRRRDPGKNLSDEICRARADIDLTPDNYIGHPTARGCLGCLSIGVRCSILDNEFDWPCASCCEEERECIPVLPPKKKAACSNCIQFGTKAKWLICSYLYEDEQDRPCRQCVQKGICGSCFAGPDLVEISQRIYIDKDGRPHLNERPSIAPGKLRRSCLGCQAAFRRCSLNEDLKFVQDSCIACEMEGRMCEPVTTDKSRWTTLSRLEHEQLKQVEEPMSPSSLESHVGTKTQPHGVQTSESTSTQLGVISKPATQSKQNVDIIEISDDSDDEKPAARPAVLSARQCSDASATSTSILRNSPSSRFKLSRSAKKPQQQVPPVPTVRSRSGTGRPATTTHVKIVPQADRPLDTLTATCKLFYTKFCHPITFNHDDFAHSDQPCHFCSEPQYAILGLPESKVFAVKLPGGKGWNQLKTLPSREGLANTRVCIACTAERFSIMQCPEHVIGRLTTSLPGCLDDAFLRLGAGVLTDRWCSICCNLATYACCATDLGDMDMIKLHEGPGCGLYLCEHCALNMHTHKNNLQAMLFDLRTNASHKRPYGLRADWDLLKRGGLLEQYIRGS